MPDFNGMDDARLVEHARQNPDAFGALYRRYLTPLYRYLYHRLDVIQFKRLYEEPIGQPCEKVKTYSEGSMVHQTAQSCLPWIRSLRRSQSIPK